MKRFLTLPILLAVLASAPASADRTRLESENYLETSDVDFTLGVKDVTPVRQAAALRVFELTGMSKGEHTVLVFVDGEFFRRQQVRLPGRYPLSLRGLAPGTHEVTLQVVESGGRIASARQKVLTGTAGTAPRE